MEIILILVGIGIGAWVALRQHAARTTPVVTEKPGYLYFLENQNNPGRIKILTQQKELVTPLRIVAAYTTPTPKAALKQVYEDLEAVHINGGWYDGQAVKMYLDHLEGTA
jgi:hypothetical protein